MFLQLTKQARRPLISMVLLVNGIWIGVLTAFWKVSVLVPGRTLPPLVAASFACEPITETGLTNSLMT